MKKNLASAIAAMMALVMLLTLACVPASAEEITTPSCFSAEFKAVIDGETMIVKTTVDATDVLNVIAACTLQMDLEGMKLDGTVISSQSAMAILSDTLLDKVYGVDMTKAVENLPNSVFAPGSGSAFELDEETYAAVSAALNGSHAGTQLGEQMAAVGMRYVEVMAAAMEGKVTSETAFEDVSIGGNEIRAMVNTYTVSTETLVQMTKAVTDAAAQDQELKALVGVLMEQSGSAAAEVGMTGAEYADIIWQELDAMAEELVNNIQTSGMTLAAKTYTQGTTLVAAEAGITMQGETLRMVFTVDNENMGASLVIYAGDVEMYGVYGQVTAEPEGILFAVTEGELEILNVQLLLTDEGYELLITQEDGTVSLAGRVFEENGCLVTTLDTINGMELGEISLTINTNAEPIVFPEYTDVLTMSQEEAETMVLYIMSVLNAMEGAEAA